jgi:hypothetical protein
MNTPRRSLPTIVCVLLICSGPLQLLGQAPRGKCFSIRVHLNGRMIAGPQVIRLRTEHGESTVPLGEGCFRVPTALLTEKAVDVSFTVPGNRIYLAGISPSFFADQWDIDLADKKFDRDVDLPKHAHVREACAVVFHGGEPENALLQTGCRTPISSKKSRYP